MTTRSRNRWLAAISDVCMRRPGVVLAIAGLLVLTAAFLIPGMSSATRAGTI